MIIPFAKNMRAVIPNRDDIRVSTSELWNRMKDAMTTAAEPSQRHSSNFVSSLNCRKKPILSPLPQISFGNGGSRPR